VDRGQERAKRRHGGERRGSEREPEPLDPLAQIVGVRDVRVEIAVGDTIVLALGFLARTVRGGGRFGLGFTLGLGVAPDVEEDFVVEDVSDEACGPEHGADPEGGAGEGAVKEHGCGGGAEVCSEEGTVDDIEEDASEGDAHVGVGAGRCAEGGEEGTVGVVGEKEGGAGEGGGGEWGHVCGVGCEGCVGERVEKGDGGGDFHEDPGVDAIEEEDAGGGGGKAAEGGIDDELQRGDEQRCHEKDTADSWAGLAWLAGRKKTLTVVEGMHVQNKPTR